MSADENQTPVRKRALVHGRVQGVGYRVSAQAEATRLGLSGTVRNRFDGTVETEAEGTHAAVEAYIRWLGEGPRWAEVTGVEVVDVDAKGTQGFNIH